MERLTGYTAAEAVGKSCAMVWILEKAGMERCSDGPDGAEQKSYVYFHRPADVREMAVMEHKHIGRGVEEDAHELVETTDNYYV